MRKARRGRRRVFAIRAGKQSKQQNPLGQACGKFNAFCRSNTAALNIPSRDTLSSEDQNAQTALLGKLDQMKEGDTLEDTRISLIR